MMAYLMFVYFKFKSVSNKVLILVYIFFTSFQTLIVQASCRITFACTKYFLKPPHMHILFLTRLCYVSKAHTHSFSNKLFLELQLYREVE